MKIKGKRVLKNGAVAGYVLQKNKTWKWRIIKGPKKNYKGGNKMLTKKNYFNKFRGTTLYEWNNTIDSLKKWTYNDTENDDNIYIHSNNEHLLGRKGFYSNEKYFKKFINPNFLNHFLYEKNLEKKKTTKLNRHKSKLPDFGDANLTIVRGHGSLTGQNFVLPEGVNVITMTVPGKSIPYSYALDLEIKHFYESGNTIYTDNDNTNTFTEEGKILGKKFKKKFNIKFKNHIGNDIRLMNDAIIEFRGPGCQSERGCGISLYNYTTGEFKEINIDSDLFNKKIINGITLKNFINTYGPGKYLLVLCRNFGFEGKSMPSIPKMTRNTSNQWNESI